MALDLSLIPNWLAILIALAPAFVVFVYFARAKGSAWLAFVLGMAGWFGALLLRLLPLQIPVMAYGPDLASNLLYVGYASLLAGIFEEGIRYICIKKVPFTRVDLRHVLSFGLGWGFGEAILIYALNIIILIFVLQPELTFLEALPGAIERNTAILLHASLSFIVFGALVKRRLLVLAVAFHTLLNVTAIFVLIYTADVWLVEGIILALAIVIALFAILITKATKGAHATIITEKG